MSPITIDHNPACGTSRNPSETVLDLLPQPQRGAVNKEDGAAVVHAEGRRV